MTDITYKTFDDLIRKYGRPVAEWLAKETVQVERANVAELSAKLRERQRDEDETHDDIEDEAARLTREGYWE